MYTCPPILYRAQQKHRDQKQYVKQAEKEERYWSEAMAKRTNKPVEFWSSLHKDGLDKYFTAQQCVELGVVDEIF